MIVAQLGLFVTESEYLVFVVIVHVSAWCWVYILYLYLLLPSVHLSVMFTAESVHMSNGRAFGHADSKAVEGLERFFWAALFPHVECQGRLDVIGLLGVGELNDGCDQSNPLGHQGCGFLSGHTSAYTEWCGIVGGGDQYKLIMNIPSTILFPITIQ